MVFVPHSMVELRKNTPESSADTPESAANRLESTSNKVESTDNKPEWTDNTPFFEALDSQVCQGHPARGAVTAAPALVASAVTLKTKSV